MNEGKDGRLTELSSLVAICTARKYNYPPKALADPHTRNDGTFLSPKVIAEQEDFAFAVRESMHL